MTIGGVAEDLKQLQRRYVDLADAPNVAECERFPDRDSAGELLAANRGYREELNQRLELDQVHAAEIQTASGYLDALAGDWRSADPSEYALENAYFSARQRKNLDAARNWLAIRTKNAEPWVCLRAQAAIAWAMSNKEEVQTLVDEALGALSTTYACGAQMYEIDLLRDLTATVSDGASDPHCEACGQG